MKSYLIKNLLVFFSLLCVAITTNAQRQRNYIYLFDCTKSMIPREKWNDEEWLNKIYSHEDVLFVKAANWMKEDIERQQNGSTFVIVPFTNTTHDVIKSFTRREFDISMWDDIKDVLLEQLKSGGNTGICAAWDKGLSYIMNCNTKNEYG